MPQLAIHFLRTRRSARAAWACAIAAVALTCGVTLAQNPPGTLPAPTVTLLPTDTRPQYWFGVAVENIPPAIAKQLKLKAEQGVMVIAVFAGSPAEKAGLRADDLLIELNGTPLTSQEDLARAANTANPAKIATKALPSLMLVSSIVYLRDGDHFTARLTPERRPTDMLVSGANSQLFTPNANAAPRLPAVRNLVLSNGNNVQYGPGYQIDANSQSNLVLREAVGTGQVSLSQETDAVGNVKNTISDSKNTYVVEAGKLDQIPANYRALARQMLAGPQTTAAPIPLNDQPQTADDRLKRLEQQNEELKKQLEEVKALLLKASPPPAGPVPVKQ